MNTGRALAPSANASVSAAASNRAARSELAGQLERAIDWFRPGQLGNAKIKLANDVVLASNISLVMQRLGSAAAALHADKAPVGADNLAVLLGHLAGVLQWHASLYRNLDTGFEAFLRKTGHQLDDAAAMLRAKW